jgi:hypothetical protein
MIRKDNKMLIRIVITDKNDQIDSIHELEYKITKNGYLSHGICQEIEYARVDAQRIGGKVKLYWRQSN